MQGKAASNPNKRLRNARELRGWTREYVAEQIGSDPKSVARWERGSTFPHPYYRQKLCELFDKNAVELGFVAEESNNASEYPPSQPPGTFESQNAKVNAGADQDVLEHPPPLPFPPNLRRLLIILTICGILIATSILSLAIYASRNRAPPSSLAARVRIKPGGEWANPANGQIVHSIIHFAAQAYPTNHGDPAIDHVNFTVHWTDGGTGKGNWQVACIAYAAAAAAGNTFTCDFNPASLNIPAGPVHVSFDVYDVKGNENSSPNGEHTIIYVP